MAHTCKQLFITIVAVLAMVVPSVSAVDYIVGDENGWTTNFDYQAWAQGKQFHVGDKLVFKYPAGVHNVLKVNGTGFAQCTAPAGTVPLTSGDDVIPLATEGRKWYICGVGSHCQAGNQRLVITVLPRGASSSPWASASPMPLPLPSTPPSTANSPSSSASYVTSKSGFGLVVVFVIGVFISFFA